MIVYALRCDSGHGFEAWFKDAASFDAQAAAGEVTCPSCGSTGVVKAPMAPNIAKARGVPAPAAEPAADPTPPAARPAPADRTARRTALREALAALRRHVESTHDYVGERFAQEARAMHDGEIAERDIFGEATLDEARDLVEDGVPVLPLPAVRTDS